MQFIQGEGDFFPAPGLQTITSAGTKLGLQDGWSGNNTLGYYLQEQVGWKDRLYLTAAARVDNNSSFGKDVKWVGYPKASISYVASEEPSAPREAAGRRSTACGSARRSARQGSSRRSTPRCRR